MGKWQSGAPSWALTGSCSGRSRTGGPPKLHSRRSTRAKPLLLVPVQHGQLGWALGCSGSGAQTQLVFLRTVDWALLGRRGASKMFKATRVMAGWVQASLRPHWATR